MPDMLVAPIESLGKHAIKLAHANGKICIRRLYQKVVVVAHQTIGVDEPVVTAANIFKR